MYFIILGSENVSTNKIGHSDTVALNHQLREASVIESPSYFLNERMSSSKINSILISEILHNSMNDYQYLPTTVVNTYQLE